MELFESDTEDKDLIAFHRRPKINNIWKLQSIYLEQIVNSGLINILAFLIFNRDFLSFNIVSLDVGFMHRTRYLLISS